MRSSSTEPRRRGDAGAWLRLTLVGVLGAAALAAPVAGIGRTGALYTDSATVTFTVVPSAPAPTPTPSPTPTPTTSAGATAAALAPAALLAPAPTAAATPTPTSSPTSSPQPTASPSSQPPTTTLRLRPHPSWPFGHDGH